MAPQGSGPDTTACTVDGIDYSHCFSLIADAGHLAAFAGVLTGVTFTALAILVARNRLDEDAGDTGAKSSTSARDHSLIGLLVAFFTFTLGTYLFTLVAAEQLPYGRAALLSFAASVVVAIGIMQLFVGLADVMSHLEWKAAATFARRLARVVIVVGYVFVAETAVDASGVRMPESAAWSTPLAYICLGFTGTLTLGSLAVSPLARRGWLPKRRALPHAAWASVAVVIVCTGVAAWASERPYKWHAPGGVYVGVMVMLLWLTGTYALLTTRREGEASPASPAGPSPDGEHGSTVQSASVPLVAPASASNGQWEHRPVPPSRDSESSTMALPVRLGPERVATQFATFLPATHLTLISVLQGVCLSVLVSELNDAPLGGSANWILYVASLTAIAYVWFLYVGAFIGFLWPYNALHTFLQFILAAAEVYAFSHIDSPRDWLLGLGATLLIGAIVRLSNIGMMAPAMYENEDWHTIDRKIEWRAVGVFAALGSIVSGAAAVFATPSGTTTVVAGVTQLALFATLLVVADRQARGALRMLLEPRWTLSSWGVLEEVVERRAEPAAHAEPTKAAQPQTS